MLREAMRGRIPKVVRARLDKMGFPVPWSKWAAKDLHEPMRDIMFERCRRGERDFSYRMFNTVGFELWAGMESRHAAP